MRIRSTMKLAVSALTLGAVMAFGTVGDAAAQDKRVRWNMASAYGSKLTQLGTLGVRLSEEMEAVSGGSLRFKFFEPGALVPALEMFDAISAGSIDAGWSTPGYWTGKNEAFALFAAVPFGPRAGEYLGWYYHGGGKELFDELYAEYGIKAVMCGVIAPEASGWFRKEINSTEDLKGLKMRFFGLGAKVMEKMGVSTQLLAGGDIFPALERGSIDATEFSMPAIDLNLGFYQVAKHYYFPGWHQQSTSNEVLVNMDKWNALPEENQAMLEVACDQSLITMIADGEASQFEAMIANEKDGVKNMTWPDSVLDQLRGAWEEVLAEELASNPDVKKLWDSYTKFHEGYKVWGDRGYLK